MSYPPPPDQSGQGGYQYDPYGGQPGSQPPSPQGGGYSQQPPMQQPGYGPPAQPQQPYGQPGMPPQMPPAYGAGMPGQELPKGMAVASMVLGIIAAALMCIPYISFVSLVTGPIAAILGGIGIKKANAGEAAGKGMAITGLVLGIIVSAFVALGLILLAVGAATFYGTSSTL